LGAVFPFLQWRAPAPSPGLSHAASRLFRRPGTGVQRTFDRRGARAVGLAARPPARFNLLLSFRTGGKLHHLKITENWSRQWGVPQRYGLVQKEGIAMAKRQERRELGVRGL